MNYNDMKAELDAATGDEKRRLRDLLAMVCLGGQIEEDYVKYAEESSTLQEFFDAIYEDDDMRFTPVWGQLAREHDPIDWLQRFEPIAYMPRVKAPRGLAFRGENTAMAILPEDLRLTPNVFVFDEAGFNEAAANLLMTFTGAYEVAGIQLDGTYDIYRAKNNFIFEQWKTNDFGERLNKRAEPRIDQRLK